VSDIYTYWISTITQITLKVRSTIKFTSYPRCHCVKLLGIPPFVYFILNLPISRIKAFKYN